MAKVWYYSDPHFYHSKIIEYCNRPFKDGQEMSELLIQLYNETVAPGDHVWFLGDLVMWRGSRFQCEAFGRLIARLHGKKRLILGNHDRLPMQAYIDTGFEKIQADHRHEGLLFSHIPLHPSSVQKARANVHGHIHDNQGKDFPPIIRDGQVIPYINISVEVTGYRPVDLDWINTKVREAQRGHTRDA